MSYLDKMAHVVVWSSMIFDAAFAPIRHRIESSSDDMRARGGCGVEEREGGFDPFGGIRYLA